MRKQQEITLCKYCKIRECCLTFYNGKNGRVYHNKLQRCDHIDCISAAKRAKAHFTGKKRPDHAIKIRAALSGKPKSEAHKANMKTNSVHYMKKMLENKNIEYTEENFYEKWRELLSISRKSEDYKWNCVKEYYKLSDDQRDQSDIEALYKKRNSEKSMLAMQNNPSMGAGVRITIDNLQNCLHSNTLTVRSRWEAKFITDYLERFPIKYSYEQVKYNGYLPDFHITLPSGLSLIVEIKGTMYEEKIDGLISGFNQIRENHVRFAFVQTEYFKKWDVDTILKFEVTSEDQLSSVIKYKYKRKKK